MIDLKKTPQTLLDAYRGNAQQRLESLRAFRLPYWGHWALLAEVFHPRRYRAFVTPNQYARGVPLNQSIVDETGLLAARTCATGMLSGLTSPTRPWFTLGVFGHDELPEGPAKIWLAECTSRMLQVYAKSNLYQSLGTVYHDDCVFGSTCILQYEDPEDIVRFYVPAMGEFFFGLDGRLEVDTIYREFPYTISEAVKAFGLENLSPSTQQLAKTPGALDTEIIFGHAIEPNTISYLAFTELPYIVPPKFGYREIYWEQATSSGQRTGTIVKACGFNEQMHSGFRWDVTSNDAYGRSPGMDGMPANRQLQIEQRRKAEAIDKMVRPPMVASMAMKNEPQDMLPGGVTFVASMDGAGFKPAYQVEPRIGELMEDLKEVQARLKEVFFVDLFMMISQLDTVRTATEIDARREEKLIQLGPVIERTERELDKIIQRTFAIMLRKGLFPPPPPELAGATITPQYVSMLAEAQRAASTSIIERMVQFVGSIMGVKPDVLDNIDTDKMVDIYGDRLGAPPEMMRAVKDILALRQQRAQEQQQQAALATGSVAAQGAQTLSQTDVGGGQNALQMMLGS